MRCETSILGSSFVLSVILRYCTSLITVSHLCTERCLLYSMKMWGEQIGALHIASGTIYNEVKTSYMAKFVIPYLVYLLLHLIMIQFFISTLHLQMLELALLFL